MRLRLHGLGTAGRGRGACAPARAAAWRRTPAPRDREAGFTLVELVIVVAIVGILASAALPLARWSVKRSKEYELQESLRILRIAIDRYHDAAQAGLIEVEEGNPGYPPDLDVLVEGVPLVSQMPPVVPGAAGEYDATGPGLDGGLEQQLQEGQEQGAGPGADGPGATGGSRFGGFGGDRGGIAEGGRGATPARPGPTGARRGGMLGQRGQSEGDAGRGGLGSRGGITFGQFGGREGAGGEAAEPLLGPDGQPVKLILLRRIPVDPMTGERDWGKRCYGEPPDDRLWCGRDVFDVYSKSLDRSIEGSDYRDW